MEKRRDEIIGGKRKRDSISRWGTVSFSFPLKGGESEMNFRQVATGTILVEVSTGSRVAGEGAF